MTKPGHSETPKAAGILDIWAATSYPEQTNGQATPTATLSLLREYTGSQMIQCPVCGSTQPPKHKRCSVCNGWLDITAGDPLIGREVGAFVLQSKIGKGGMGAIYRAKHKVLGTFYAIKLLHPQFASDPELLERFRREAIAASQLKHDNVVFIADFGWAEGVGAYIAMEYLEGLSLGDHIRQKALLSVDQTKSIINQICKALTAAHKQGIIHRDLKPDNVFLCHPESDDEPPRVKVLDFGIARIVKEQNQQGITNSDAAIGTPQYMSPEQAQARWDIVDHRTDLYALGVIVYHLLTGYTPLPKGSVHEVILRKAQGESIPLTQYRPELRHTAMARFIERAISLHMDERPPSAKAFYQELSDAFTDYPSRWINPGGTTKLLKLPTPISAGSQIPSSATRFLPGGIVTKNRTDSQSSLPSFAPAPIQPMPQSPISPSAQPAYQENASSMGNDASNTYDSQLYNPGNSRPGFVLFFVVLSGSMFGLGFYIWTLLEEPGTRPTSPPSSLRLATPTPPRRVVLRTTPIPSIRPTPTRHILPTGNRQPKPKLRALQPRKRPTLVRKQRDKTLYTLRLISRPAARVYQNGRLLCRSTPCVIRGKAGQAIVVWLNKTGHYRRRFRWVPKRNRRVILWLKSKKPVKRRVFDHVPI